MRKLLFVIFVISTLQGFAQSTITIHSKETGKAEEIGLPESMTLKMDTLLQNWHNKNFLTATNDCYTSSVNPTYPDSVYVDRLSRMPTIMEMPYNDVVREFIDMYSGRLRNKVSVMLGACNFYIPLFEEALDLYGLPYELKYLPVIESALNPTAVSRAGAAGLWQFMLSTGRLYGLESNSLVDDRYDPIKSTYAAARYLKDLYDIYKDWNLVIAAYNCGPGTIIKAIHRANGASDYWEIYNYLPKETRGYVPAFIAANYIMNYYCDHNICPMDATLPNATDTIIVTKDLHFRQIAEVCQIDLEEIRALNPQYKKDIVPGNSSACIVRLPQNQITAFIDAKDSVYDYRADELLNKRKLVAVKETGSRNRNVRNTRSSSYSSKASYYKIKKGDTLSSIAAKHKVSVKHLQRLNNLKGTNITAGKSIRIN